MALLPYSLPKSVLFNLDPEAAHELTMAGLARFQNTPLACLWGADRVQDPVEIAGITFPNRVGPLPKKPPTAYLRDGQLFFDTIVFTPEALRHLIAETGPGQIVIGTDYPFPWTSTEVDLVLSTPGLSDAERIAILGGTAAKLLGID